MYATIPLRVYIPHVLAKDKPLKVYILHVLAKDKPGIYHKSELSQVKDIPERYRNLNLGKDVSAVLGQKKVKPDRKVKQWGLQLLGKDLSQVKDILERYRNLSDREKSRKTQIFHCSITRNSLTRRGDLLPMQRYAKSLD